MRDIRGDRLMPVPGAGMFSHCRGTFSGLSDWRQRAIASPLLLSLELKKVWDNDLKRYLTEAELGSC